MKSGKGGACGPQGRVFRADKGGVTGEWYLSRDLKEEGNVLQMGQVPSRETACAKALRQERAWHVMGRARDLLPLSPYSLW